MLWRDDQLRWSPACVLAVVAFALPAALPAARRAGARVHHRRAPSPRVHPRHGRPFTPVTGDWEGQLGSLHASFRLVPRRGAYAIEDLVYQQPDACPARTDVPSSSFVSYAAPPPPYLTVSRDGAFRPLGALLSARLASLSAPYRLRHCQGALSFGLIPSARPRRRVDDGRWRLSAADGSQSTFTVRDGGRVAYGLALSSVTATCPAGIAPGSFTGALGLFVGPDGSAAQTLTGSGLSMTVTLRFTSPRTADGSYTVSATDCTTRTLRFNARRS